LAAGFCPKNLAFARKNDDGGGCTSPSPDKSLHHCMLSVHAGKVFTHILLIFQPLFTAHRRSQQSGIGI